MTNKELTELMIKQLLHEWKRIKSTTTAYDICNTLCEYYKINEKDKMKLRNKKTGEIVDARKIGFEIYSFNERLYNSIAELNEEWEDYKPAEPIIKDEKVRKAIRAWLSIQKQTITAISISSGKDHDGFFCYHLYGYIDKARIVDGKAVVNNNLTAIMFEFRSNEAIEYDRNRDYTIAELCGEEEE